MLRRLRRLSERDLRTADRTFVAFLALVATVDLASNSEREGALPLNLAIMGAIALSFLWRRTRPWVTLVALFSGLLVMSVWLTDPPNVLAAILMLLTTAYSSGRHLAGRSSIRALVLGTGIMVVLALIFDPRDVFFPVVFFWIVPWLAGRTIRNQTMLARELAEKAERAEHERAEEERRAIALERSRIARELHDVLAHNLSVMVVQAAAARRIVERDPERAGEVAELIQRTGREALAELRHLFGPVRRGEGEDLSGPPSLARLDELARRARSAGLRVELHTEGTAVDLPAGIDQTAYRIVQEALTNALKHSGGTRASVMIRYEPNEVSISVEDDGAGPSSASELAGAGGGHGLVGMRERAALYGGIVQAGRRRGGGFAVRARLPTQALVPGAELSGAGRVSA